jgi:hypothetical protein
MKQTEKLASAMYLVKSAGMQEKLQDAARYVKHIFNPPTDEEVWASRDKIRPVDQAKVAPDTGNVLMGLSAGLPPAIAISLGGLGLGTGAGRAFGPNIIKRIVKATMTPAEKVKFTARELLDDTAVSNLQRKLKAFGGVGGGLLGGLLGAGAGGAAGGSIAEDFIKDDVIKKMREAGYPKN